jgi:RimJ/RimL family protein N-acetyltransferase
MQGLETQRLELRLPVSADAAPLMDIHLDPLAKPHVTMLGAPSGLLAAWRNIALMVGHWQLRGYGQWTVIEKSTGEVIGRVGLWHPDGWTEIELGWIIKPSRWGNGLATEACAGALAWTWENVQTDHIVSLIHPANSAAIRVAEKIGARFEREEVLEGKQMHVYGVHRPIRA